MIVFNDYGANEKSVSTVFMNTEETLGKHYGWWDMVILVSKRSFGGLYKSQFYS